MQMDEDIRIAGYVAKLQQYMQRNKLTQAALATVTGVDQSQLSRILSGKSKRISKNMQILLQHAQINWSAEDWPAPQHPRLVAAVHAAWDGTEVGGDALATLIEAAAALGRAGS